MRRISSSPQIPLYTSKMSGGTVPTSRLGSEHAVPTTTQRYPHWLHWRPLMIFAATLMTWSLLVDMLLDANWETLQQWHAQTQAQFLRRSLIPHPFQELRPETASLAVNSSAAHRLGRWSGALPILGAGYGATGRFEADTPIAHTLVVYIYSASDPACADNLRFFVRSGVRDSPDVDYVFVVQLDAGQQLEDLSLPALPQNARYLGHPNRCYDWGTFGELAFSGELEPHKYKYILFMNSSVRGPFLPAHYPATVQWTEAFTSRLKGSVKLVGPTISCEQGPVDASQATPHVQSYLVAMDQAAYQLLLASNSTLMCYQSMQDVIVHSELGSSKVILDAGYTIDTLMLRYQGIDWTDRRNWDCNGRLNPYASHAYDGLNLSPLEVMFVKVKDFMLHAGWTTAHTAVKYDEWTNLLTRRNISSNSLQVNERAVRDPARWLMKYRNASCFDADTYSTRNPDLGHLSAGLLWQHFIQSGQFEGRPWRMNCSNAEWETLLPQSS